VLPGQDEYMRLRNRETGINLVYRYPFSRFSRLEFDNRIYQVEQAWDWLPAANVASETWIEDIQVNKDTVFAPGLSMVFDNSLSGSTGPLVGWRALYHIRKSFAIDDLEYLTNYVDIRSYNLFSRRYSLAMRLNAGVSTGKNPDRFSLSGYYGVRALDSTLSGHKKALASMELRFPFMDYIAIAFPIPLAMGNIRGSIFADAGSVWDDTDKFRGMNKNKLQDIKLGYGFGPRMNLGYFVLKFDVTWLTDLSEIGKPTYYLSLTEDF
jgi:outer membrane protein assembly factor BamA